MSKLWIRNAVVIDGTGRDPFPGDVLVAEDKIAAIGCVEAVEGCETLNADGRCLTPGFVDLHRHADLQVFSPAFGEAELFQGITTCFSGNCGMSASPCPPGREEELYGYLEPCLGKVVKRTGFPSFAQYAEALSSIRLPLNMGAFVGGGAVRIAVKGFDPSPMSAAELDAAKAYVAEAMQAGAAGLSMGLMYAPECHTTADELTSLAREAGKRGGILTVHVRGEGASLLTSVGEVLDIARRAEVPVNISHFKAAGRSNWDRLLCRAIERIEEARRHGQDVTCDAYPYSAGSTMLLTLLPPGFLASGVPVALARIASRQGRIELKNALSLPHDGWDNLVLDLGWGSVIASGLNQPENQRYVGRSIQEIAEETGRDEVDCLCDLLISEKGRAGMVIHSMSPADVERVLKLPYCNVISDAIYPPSGNPHPRLYGAFPRVLREYVREKGTLTLPEAIRKMTSQPAARVSLKDRGVIREGAVADLLLFRPERVSDEATYADPKRLAIGIDAVFLGGKAVIVNGMKQLDHFGHFIERR